MIFASDLDNTIIHSYKKMSDGDVCVEVKDKKELSYMKEKNYKILQDLVKKCTFIPVTTRSLEQYRRIDFGFVPNFAIVANGSILLRDGQIDKDWQEESKKVLDVDLPKLEENEYLYDIRYVDDFFVFAKSDSPKQASGYLKSVIKDESFNICDIFNKVYVIPKKINKGLAIERLRKRFGGDFILSAGDSFLDIAMLDASDMAIYPEGLDVRNINKLQLNKDIFHIQMIKNAIKIIIKDSNINS